MCGRLRLGASMLVPHLPSLHPLGSKQGRARVLPRDERCLDIYGLDLVSLLTMSPQLGALVDF